MSRYQSLLGLAAVMAAGGFSLGAATPAKADLQVCNNSKTTAFAAIGFSLGPDRWYSQGWWEIPNGRCERVLTGNLKPGTYFYLYAFNQEKTRIWQGENQTSWFCVKPRENFVLTTSGNECAGRGTAKQVFWEIRVDNTSQAVNLN